MTNSGKIVVDTDVLLDFFRGYPPASNFINQYEKNVRISSVTVTDLYSGARSREEVQEIEDLLNLIQSLM